MLGILGRSWGEERCVILAGRHERKTQLGGPWHLWKNDMEMNLKGLGFGSISLHETGPGFGPLAGSHEHSNLSDNVYIL
jgi:hypothetical protein